MACEWNATEMIELLVDAGGEELIRLKNGDDMDSLEFSYAENMEQPYRYLRAKLGLSD